MESNKSGVRKKMPCTICVEEFNLLKRKRVECFRCHESACSSCIETYLLSKSDDAHCMFCRIEWDRMFLGSVLPGTFVHKAYKAHREMMLFEREKCLLPGSMAMVESDARIDEMLTEFRQVQTRMLQLQRTMNTLNTRIERERHRKHRMLSGQIPMGGDAGAQAAAADTERVHYRRPCVNDSCNGFINSRTGECLSCHKTTCVKCNVIMIPEQEHECDKEDLEAWEIIRGTTRPCPGCSTRITKVSGCAQMWCPQCHTAFNWNTGQIETGPIHNPHYYEWMFNGNGGGPPMRNPFADACNDGVLPGIREVLNRIRTGERSGIDKTICDFHNKVQHIRRVVLRTDEDLAEKMTIKRNELRLSFLKNKIDEQTFRVKIQRVDKEESKKREYNRILETFTVVCSDLFRQFTASTTFPQKDLWNAIKNARNITNDAINRLNHCYHSDLMGV